MVEFGAKIFCNAKLLVGQQENTVGYASIFIWVHQILAYLISFPWEFPRKCHFRDIFLANIILVQTKQESTHFTANPVTARWRRTWLCKWTLDYLISHFMESNLRLGEGAAFSPISCLIIQGIPLFEMAPNPWQWVLHSSWIILGTYNSYSHFNPFWILGKGKKGREKKRK